MTQATCDSCDNPFEYEYSGRGRRPAKCPECRGQKASTPKPKSSTVMTLGAGRTATAAPGKVFKELPTEAWEYDDYRAAGKNAVGIVQGAQWYLGALAAGVGKKYGDDKLGKFAQDIGISAGTLSNHRTTFEAWRESSLRSELSYSVAKALNSQADREDLVKANPKMTVAEARKIVQQRNAGKPRTTAASSPDISDADITEDKNDVFRECVSKFETLAQAKLAVERIWNELHTA
jgi:hypothetical protein